MGSDQEGDHLNTQASEIPDERRLSVHILHLEVLRRIPQPIGSCYHQKKMVYEPSQRPFIVRIRCPQGLLRIPVTGKERWNTIVRNLPASHLPPNTTCTLIKSTDTGKTDLLSSYINGQTLDDQGVQHGDMFYLQPESAPRQDQVAIESKSSSHTSQPVDISRSTLTSPQPSSTKQEQVESVTSNWSHVAIFARIRGNFCPGSGVPTKTAT